MNKPDKIIMQTLIFWVAVAIVIASVVFITRPFGAVFSQAQPNPELEIPNDDEEVEVDQDQDEEIEEVPEVLNNPPENKTNQKPEVTSQPQVLGATTGK